MPLQAQVRLLRVLEHHEIERVGGMQRIPVGIRIIAATHQGLSAMVRAGQFREAARGQPEHPALQDEEAGDPVPKSNCGPVDLPIQGRRLPFSTKQVIEFTVRIFAGSTHETPAMLYD